MDSKIKDVLEDAVVLTDISSQEGFRGHMPVIVSGDLADVLGYDSDSPNWRVRALLATAATAVRDVPMTPVHKFRINGKTEGRRFRLSDEVHGVMPICSVVVRPECRCGQCPSSIVLCMESELGDLN